jgi:hypothetical protein
MKKTQTYSDKMLSKDTGSEDKFENKFNQVYLPDKN